MRSIECEGDTIDEAINRALSALKVSRDGVQIEILGSATKGLLGFGSRKARIRATVRGSLSTALETADASTAPSDVSQETYTDRAVVSRSALAERASSVLEEILAHLGVTCAFEVRHQDDPETIVLAVSGEGSGLVIGRRGQTLDAIEYLLNRTANRGDDAAGVRIVVDVEGYRERRQESLEQLARRLAAKVRQTGRVVTLNPMSPRDRRIVHITLKDEAVVTRSEGDGHYRRLLIIPQDHPQRPRRDLSDH
jgi:spoIIIJ-associated protein